MGRHRQPHKQGFPLRLNGRYVLSFPIKSLVRFPPQFGNRAPSRHSPKPVGPLRMSLGKMRPFRSRPVADILAMACYKSEHRVTRASLELAMLQLRRRAVRHTSCANGANLVTRPRSETSRRIRDAIQRIVRLGRSMPVPRTQLISRARCLNLTTAMPFELSASR